MAKIILITGPSAAGKSTVCQKLLEDLSGEWAYINQDEIRQFVSSGYASADQQISQWTDAVRRQWNASIPICADIAKNYLKNGIGSVVDFFVYPDELDAWKSSLAGLDYELFVLLPKLEVLQTRNSNREQRSELSAQKIKENFEFYKAYQFNKQANIIDTTHLDPLETVQVIKELAKIN